MQFGNLVLLADSLRASTNSSLEAVYSAELVASVRTELESLWRYENMELWMMGGSSEERTASSSTSGSGPVFAAHSAYCTCSMARRGRSHLSTLLQSPRQSERSSLSEHVCGEATTSHVLSLHEIRNLLKAVGVKPQHATDGCYFVVNVLLLIALGAPIAALQSLFRGAGHHHSNSNQGSTRSRVGMDRCLACLGLLDDHGAPCITSSRIEETRATLLRQQQQQQQQQRATTSNDRGASGEVGNSSSSFSSCSSPLRVEWSASRRSTTLSGTNQPLLQLFTPIALFSWVVQLYHRESPLLLSVAEEEDDHHRTHVAGTSARGEPPQHRSQQRWGAIPQQQQSPTKSFSTPTARLDAALGYSLSDKSSSSAQALSGGVGSSSSPSSFALPAALPTTNDLLLTTPPSSVSPRSQPLVSNLTGTSPPTNLTAPPSPMAEAAVNHSALSSPSSSFPFAGIPSSAPAPDESSSRDAVRGGGGESLSWERSARQQLSLDNRVRCFLLQQWRRVPLVVLLGGTSGCGKSTLASLLAHRLGITTIISTDGIREILRGKREEQTHPELFVSTYEAHSVYTPNSVSAPLNVGAAVAESSSQEVGAFVKQATMVLDVLDKVIDKYVARGESIVVEGVHLLPSYCVARAAARPKERLASPSSPSSSSSFSSCSREPLYIPLVVQIDNRNKHLSRFAIRAKAMTLVPNQNKYVRNFNSIRRIQAYLVTQARERDFLTINNTNVDKSLSLLHAYILRCVDCWASLARNPTNHCFVPASGTTAADVIQQVKGKHVGDLLRRRRKEKDSRRARSADPPRTAKDYDGGGGGGGVGTQALLMMSLSTTTEDALGVRVANNTDTGAGGGALISNVVVASSPKLSSLAGTPLTVSLPTTGSSRGRQQTPTTSPFVLQDTNSAGQFSLGQQQQQQQQGRNNMQSTRSFSADAVGNRRRSRHRRRRRNPLQDEQEEDDDNSNDDGALIIEKQEGSEVEAEELSGAEELLHEHSAGDEDVPSLVGS